MEGSHVIVIQFKQHSLTSHFGYKGKRFHAAGWGGVGGGGVMQY